MSSVEESRRIGWPVYVTTETRISDNLDFVCGVGIEESVDENHGEIVRTWWGAICGRTF